MNGTETITNYHLEHDTVEIDVKETPELKELPDDIEDANGSRIEPLDVGYIERTMRVSLLEQFSLRTTETKITKETAGSETVETKSEGLTEEEKQIGRAHV